MPLSLNLESLKLRIRSMEDKWFDTTRRVETASGWFEKPDMTQIAGELRDSYLYLPVRASHGREAIRALPIKQLQDYTFIDMGSGKGKMLFVAAEYPFRKIIGVEFSKKLHDQAATNCSQYRHAKQRCPAIEAIHANATEFEFPEGNLVVYLFNPFGPDVMGRMLENLQRSMKRSPRHVVVLMLWPEHWQGVAGMAEMHECRKTQRYHVYQTV